MLVFGRWKVKKKTDRSSSPTILFPRENSLDYEELVRAVVAKDVEMLPVGDARVALERKGGVRGQRVTPPTPPNACLPPSTISSNDPWLILAATQGDDKIELVRCGGKQAQATPHLPEERTCFAFSLSC